MGSPLSPTIADLTMRNLEERALDTLCIPLPFYFWYVDDIALTIPSNLINEAVNIFNFFHPRLQFTKEIWGDKLNFLDVTIFKKSIKVEFNWYHKTSLFLGDTF